MCRESTALQGQSLKEPKVLLRTSRSGQAVPLRSLELSRVAGAVAGQRPQWSLATGSSRGTSVFTMLELESHVTAALRRCYTTLFLARCPGRPWLALQRQRPCAHLPCTSQRWPWPYCHGLPTSGHRFCRSQLTAGGPASRPSLWLSYTMPAVRFGLREPQLKGSRISRGRGLRDALKQHLRGLQHRLDNGETARLRRLLPHFRSSLLFGTMKVCNTCSRGSR